jgi:hypothetical protein
MARNADWQTGPARAEQEKEWQAVIYYVCFAATADEPHPSLDAMATVEADSPGTASRHR